MPSLPKEQRPTCHTCGGDEYPAPCMSCGRWFCDDHGGPVSKYLVSDPCPRKGLLCEDCWQEVKPDVGHIAQRVANGWQTDTTDGKDSWRKDQ